MAKVITRGVISWETLEVLEEESHEYAGPWALAKDSGSPPQAVDPYTQAAAQYGLSTGTALFNAGLNRTNSVNPIGSTSWSASYPNQAPGAPSAPTQPEWTAHGPTTPPTSAPGSYGFGGTVPFGGGQNGFGGPIGAGYGYTPNTPTIPGGGGPGSSPYGGAPQYTQTTSLAPQFQSQLEKPIDTSGLAGLPGGPSTTQDLQSTQDALYKSQQQYLAPEQALQSEQLKSQLANQGITPGSEAYNNEMDRLSREQEFSNSNARTQAITGAGQEQSRLFGLGTQGLQNQLAIRNAPISEWAALNGTGGANAQALTPDISGAFGQQYQGQLAGYNAGVASDNATTGAISSLVLAAAMAF